MSATSQKDISKQKGPEIEQENGAVFDPITEIKQEPEENIVDFVDFKQCPNVNKYESNIEDTEVIKFVRISDGAVKIIQNSEPADKYKVSRHDHIKETFKDIPETSQSTKNRYTFGQSSTVRVKILKKSHQEPQNKSSFENTSQRSLAVPARCPEKQLADQEKYLPEIKQEPEENIVDYLHYPDVTSYESYNQQTEASQFVRIQDEAGEFTLYNFDGGLQIKDEFESHDESSETAHSTKKPTKSSVDRVRKYRKMLLLPENAKRLEIEKMRRREMDKRYREKQLANPETAEIYLQKRREMYLNRKMRKKQALLEAELKKQPKFFCPICNKGYKRKKAFKKHCTDLMHFEAPPPAYEPPPPSTSKGSIRTRRYRENLNNPENAEKLEQFKIKRREHARKYKEKMLADPVRAELYRKKRSWAVKNSRKRKQWENMHAHLVESGSAKED